MTTADIETCQITLVTKDGRMLISQTDNPVIKNLIVGMVKFVKVDAERFATTSIKEIIKK